MPQDANPRTRPLAARTTPSWPPAQKCDGRPTAFQGVQFRLPGATGLCLSKPPGLAQSGTAGQYQHEVANLRARVSPQAPLRARETNALLRACFPGTPKGTQRHRCLAALDYLPCPNATAKAIKSGQRGTCAAGCLRASQENRRVAARSSPLPSARLGERLLSWGLPPQVGTGWQYHSARGQVGYPSRAR